MHETVKLTTFVYTGYPSTLHGLICWLDLDP